MNIDMDPLVNACNGKTLFQGGLNLTQFKAQLMNQFPNNAEQIKKLTKRTDLQSLCFKLLESASQIQCSCLNNNGKRCTRNVSKKPGYDTRFCWQHQNCQKLIAPITEKPLVQKTTAKKVPPVPITKKVPPVPITKKVPPVPITKKVPPVPITKKVPPVSIKNKVPPVSIKKKVPPHPHTVPVPITGKQVKDPIIDLYEFKIEKYSKKLNPFSNGFKMSENQCGRIFTDNTANLPTNANLSSCDLIETDFTTDWEKIINEDFSVGYLSKEMTPLRLIKDIYYECKQLASKSSIEQLQSKNQWHRFCEKWGEYLLQTIQSLTNQYISFFNQLGLNAQSVQTLSYIQRVTVSPDEKIIMMGDFHGSFHTFLRHMFRFHRLGIVNLKTLKLNPKHRLIFLGDVVDRGHFSLEISLVILKLMEINNDDYRNPLVIYNRGNHETASLSKKYGLLNEFESRCQQKGYDLWKQLTQFYNCLPSAVILEVPKNGPQVDPINSFLSETSKNLKKVGVGVPKTSNQFYRYWLCHGGFDPSLLNPKSDLSLALKHALKPVIVFTDNKQQDNVRWSDFYDSERNNPPVNKDRGIALIYNKYHVYQFLTLQNINFIIRGHQDHYDNNYLFSPSFQIPKYNRPKSKDQLMPGFGLNWGAATQKPLLIPPIPPIQTQFEKNGDMVEIPPIASIHGQKHLVVKYNEDYAQGLNDRLKGPFARLLANSQDYLLSQVSSGGKIRPYYYAKITQVPSQVFPVLTISTNTDVGRRLEADSFIVLRFDLDWTDPVSGYLVEQSQMQTINDLIGAGRENHSNV